MREEFSAVRIEMRTLHETAMTQMRVLHEEVLSRIAMLQEGRRRPRR
jgi:hypothetical protein